MPGMAVHTGRIIHLAEREMFAVIGRKEDTAFFGVTIPTGLEVVSRRNELVGNGGIFSPVVEVAGEARHLGDSTVYAD